MTDREVLSGFFESARYLTKVVYSKYGLHPGIYADTDDVNFAQLRCRLREVVRSDFAEPISGDELRTLLGKDFSWVKSSLDENGACVHP